MSNALRRTGTALLVVAVAVASASCSEPKSAVGAIKGPLSAADAVGDVPTKNLVEPPPPGRTARLLAKSGEIDPFCSVRGRIDALVEPPPHSLKKSLAYARLYYTALRTMNVDEEWANPHRKNPGAPAKIGLSARERQALKVERAEVYAYLVRLEVAAAYDKEGLLTGAQRRTRLDAAFTAFADGPYGDADALLSTFTAESC